MPASASPWRDGPRGRRFGRDHPKGEKRGKMAKKKRKKSEKIRNLKYGNISLAKEKSKSSGSKESETPKISQKTSPSKENKEFKKELRRSLTFTGSFLLILLALYFVLTKTSLLNPILNMLGLSGLYN